MRRPMPHTPPRHAGRRGFNPILVMLSLMLTLPLAPVATGQDATAPRAEAARAIRAAVERLSQLRQQGQSARTAHTDQIAQIERDLDRLNREIATIEPQVEQQRESVAALQEQLAADQTAAGQGKTQINDLAALILPVVQGMQQRVAAGIAYQRAERTEELEAIASALKQLDPVAKSAAIERFFRFAAQELQLSRTTELWNEPLTLDAPDGPRRVNAYQLRLGLVNQLMLSEDGATVGQWQAGTWNMQPAAEHRRQIIEVFRVMQEQRPPAITTVPFPAPRSHAAGEAGR